MMGRILVVFLLLLLSQQSHADFMVSSPVGGTQPLSLSLTYDSYTVVRQNDSPNVLSSSMTITSIYRIRKVYALTAHVSQTESKNYKTYGIGMRVYLPGFFLFGSDLYELISHVERGGFVSYGFGSINQTISIDGTTGNVSTNYQPKIGIGFDVKFTKSFFLEANMFTEEFFGKNYLGFGAGLGYNF